MDLHFVPSWSTRLTALALVGVAVGIWVQAPSGAPEYPTIPPGPVVLVALAVAIALVYRWRWLPVTGTLLSALVLAGAFATPYTARRLSDPAAVGAFAGTVFQPLAPVLGVVAGISATAEGYRSRTVAALLRILGAIFVAIGLVALARGAPEGRFHDLLHVATGVVAHYLGFAGPPWAAKTLCLAFGAFYLALGVLGMVAGDPAANRLWDVGPLHLTAGDHGFHPVLGTIFLTSGLLSYDAPLERSDERRAAALALSRR